MWTRSVVHHLAESIFSLLQCFNKLMVYVRPCLHTQIGRVESSHLLSGYSKKEKCWSAASLLICFPKVTYYQIANSVFSCLIYIRESTFNNFTTQQLTLEEKKIAHNYEKTQNVHACPPEHAKECDNKLFICHWRSTNVFVWTAFSRLISENEIKKKTWLADWLKDWAQTIMIGTQEWRHRVGPPRLIERWLCSPGIYGIS